MDTPSLLSPPRRPIRLARVLTRPGVGGAARHVGLLTREIAAPGFETRLFCGPPRQQEGDFFALHLNEFHAVMPIQIPSLRREAAPGRDLRALRHLVRQFREWQPDIVDTHLSKAGILGRLAARLTGVTATVHTYHVNIFSGYDWRPGERALYLALERRAALWSDCLICLTEELGHEFRALGIGRCQQYRTLELGIDIAAFEASETQVKTARQQLRNELGLEAHTPLIGLICRLAPVKSVKTALEAAQLLGKDSKAHWVVVGEGETRGRLEALARELKIAERVHFLGLRSDIAALNWAFDLVVLTSLQEGTPISLIESLAASRPVIATDVGGVSRLVQHQQTGLLIPPRNAQALANSVKEVFEHPRQARERARAGHQKMRLGWSQERLIERHKALYTEVLNGKFLY